MHALELWMIVLLAGISACTSRLLRAESDQARYTDVYDSHLGNKPYLAPTSTNSIRNWSNETVHDRLGSPSRLHSIMTCTMPEHSSLLLNTPYCRCVNCCTWQEKVYVFDDEDEDDMSQRLDAVQIKMMAGHRDIEILYRNSSAALAAGFSKALWIEEPTHFTLNYRPHILAQWYWHADVFHTWKTEDDWIDRDFHWMLKKGSGSVERDHDFWMAATHPTGELPVKLSRHVNSKTKVCFRDLMVGHRMIAQGLSHHLYDWDKYPRGTNAKPTLSVSREVAAVLKEYSHYFASKIPELAAVQPLRRRALYISRSDASKRRILNEEAVLGVLEEEGYSVDIVTFGGLSQQEANLRIRAAALVVGIHGAGFANILACTPQTAVLEVHPWGFQKFIFAHLASALGMKYLYWVAPSEKYVQHTKESMSSPANSVNFYRHRDVMVDIGAFRALVREAAYMEDLKSSPRDLILRLLK